MHFSGSSATHSSGHFCLQLNVTLYLRCGFIVVVLNLVYQHLRAPCRPQQGGAGISVCCVFSGFTGKLPFRRISGRDRFRFLYDYYIMRDWMSPYVYRETCCCNWLNWATTCSASVRFLPVHRTSLSLWHVRRMVDGNCCDALLRSSSACHHVIHAPRWRLNDTLRGCAPINGAALRRFPRCAFVNYHLEKNIVTWCFAAHTQFVASLYDSSSVHNTICIMYMVGAAKSYATPIWFRINRCRADQPYIAIGFPPW